MHQDRTVPIATTAALLCLAAGAGLLHAQQIEVPRAGTTKVEPAVSKVFDAAHLKDRPYDGNLPAPAFPSSQRVQRSFTVSYIYDYALSTYTPAADLPTIARGQARRDTPENAAIALFAAQRAGDFDGFLQCWTEADRKRIQAMVKSPDLGLPAVLAKWKQVYGANKVQLIDRVETIGYVILDVRVGGGQMPAIFKQVDGQWLATNDLGDSGNQVLSSMRPDLAGLILHVQPAPADQLIYGRVKEKAAQRDFLDQHDQRTDIIRTGQ